MESTAVEGCVLIVERWLIGRLRNRVFHGLAELNAAIGELLVRLNAPEEFVGRFSERIQALSANQDLLAQNGWQGVDVEDLVQAQLAHFVDLIGSRITAHGPKLRPKAASAQAIGLAFHELATQRRKIWVTLDGYGLRRCLRGDRQQHLHHERRPCPCQNGVGSAASLWKQW